MLASSDLAYEGALVRFGPERYYVVDGDTIQILSDFAGPGGKRPPVHRLRFRSIAAPEISLEGRAEIRARKLGLSQHVFCAGVRSADQLRAFTKRRDILVLSSGRFDTYGRYLVDVSVVPGKPGAGEAVEAISLERLMIERRHAEPFVGERLPELRPFAGQDADFAL